MKTHKLRIAGILFISFIVCLGLGRYFDSTCGDKSCLRMSLHDALQKGGNELNLAFAHVQLNGDEMRILDGDEEGDEEMSPTIPPAPPVPPAPPSGLADNTELPSLDGVESIQINSVSTEWVVSHTEDKAKLFFTNTKKNRRVEINRDGKELTITIRSKGPENGDLNLPANYAGTLAFHTVSGDIHIGEKLSAKALHIDTASGDVDFGSWPKETLEINTVSGDVQSHAKGTVPKVIVLHSVSGDFRAAMDTVFDSFTAQSVSGDVSIQIPKTATFSYEMHSVSGEFNGLPEGGTFKDGPGNKRASGTFGTAPKSQIIFNSVSGDFRLEDYL